jgi:signal transduction histidine kinase
VTVESSPGRLERVAEDAIIADVLRWGLPLMTCLASFAFVAGLLAANQLRAVPGVVALVLCIGAWVSARVGRQRVAIWLLASAVAFAASFAMVFNGGPESQPTIDTSANTRAAAGARRWRGATITAALTTVTVIAIGFASNAGLLREPPLAPPLLHALFLCVYIWLVWITTAYPQRRLRMALQEAALLEAARRAEEQRRVESELAFKSVFDNSAQVVMVASSGGELLHLNRAAWDFLGVQEEAAVMHQPVVNLPGWCDESRARIAEGLQRLLPGRSATFEVRRGQVHFEFTLTRMPTSPSLGTGGVLLEGRDVRGLLEGEQREARARRLSLVGQLAGGVAHDFNNVLAVVMTSTEMLRADLEGKGPLSEEINESLEAIATSTQRASDLTRRLLTFSRQQPLAPKLISMHDFVESAVKLLQRVLPPRITVSAELTAARDTVKADVSSLESALLNLAINARDAMPGPGRLTISTSLVEPDELWEASGGSARWPDSFLRVSVRDTGAGIPRELQDRLFEPFITTKEEGTGIGLASVFTTMHDHGGT